jgi:hypothetical protein
MCASDIQALKLSDLGKTDGTKRKRGSAGSGLTVMVGTGWRLRSDEGEREGLATLI